MTDQIRTANWLSARMVQFAWSQARLTFCPLPFTTDCFWSSRANGHLEFHALDLPLGLQSHWVAPHQPAVAGFWVPKAEFRHFWLTTQKLTFK
ncbi:hypothetical protein [Rhodoferax ferrireducens]|uniref:hypothetical protein n=1 Tax=Rhodoferax ferrireducens TaxID=192843 RepID=UPI00140F7B72|nr:hypothetical protein [Rhodoferax ferrireducens]